MERALPTSPSVVVGQKLVLFEQMKNSLTRGDTRGGSGFKKENKVLGCVSILVAIDQQLNTRTSWLKHPFHLESMII